MQKISDFLLCDSVNVRALLAVGLRGLDANVYTQIGFILMVELSAKNAILIAKFAAAAAIAMPTAARPITVRPIQYVVAILRAVCAATHIHVAVAQIPYFAATMAKPACCFK